MNPLVVGVAYTAPFVFLGALAVLAVRIDSAPRSEPEPRPGWEGHDVNLIQPAYDWSREVG